MRQRLNTSELFLKAQTDERLAALAGEGHTRAFTTLVERHRRALLGHAGRMVGPDRAEDVLQQALLKAWRSLDDGVDVRHPQPWLHRIVHNAALTEIERQPQNVDSLGEDVADRGSAAAVVEQRLAAREVLQGLADLPQRQRLALLGTELEGRTRRQLADELGLSEGAVRQLVHRARSRVRTGIAVLVPFPLVERITRASGWVRDAGVAGQLRPAAEVAGGSGLLASGAVKLAAVVVAAGAVGGGALLHAGDRAGHRRPTPHTARRHGAPVPQSPGAQAGAATRLLASGNEPTPAPLTVRSLAGHMHRERGGAGSARDRTASTDRHRRADDVRTTPERTASGTGGDNKTTSGDNRTTSGDNNTTGGENTRTTGADNSTTTAQIEAPPAKTTTSESPAPTTTTDSSSATPNATDSVSTGTTTTAAGSTPQVATSTTATTDQAPTSTSDSGTAAGDS